MPVEKWEVEGLDLANATLTEHMSLLREIPTAAKEVGASMRELTNVQRQYRRGIVAIRTEWRNQHAAWIETMRIARRVQSVFRTFRSLFDSYTMGQIRIERQTRDVADAQKSAAEWQSLYNQYLRDFGDESIYATEAYDNWQDAIGRAKDEQDALNKAQNDMLAFWVSAYVEMPITVAFAVTGIASNLNTLRNVMKLTSADAKAMWASIGLGAAALTAVAATRAETLRIQEEAGHPVQEDMFAVQPTDFYTRSVKPLVDYWTQIFKDLGLIQKEVETSMESVSGDVVDEFQQIIDATHETTQATEEYRDAIERLGDTAYRGSVLPDIVEWTRKAKTELQSLNAGIGKVSERTTVSERPSVRSVSLTQSFGDVHGIEDLERASDAAYRALIKRIEDQW